VLRLEVARDRLRQRGVVRHRGRGSPGTLPQLVSQVEHATRYTSEYGLESAALAFTSRRSEMSTHIIGFGGLSGGSGWIGGGFPCRLMDPHVARL
jgi:hypothetical protein